MGKISVLGTEISYYQQNEHDYISLTDMVRNIENGLALIEKWLRNKNTIEFLDIWEEIYNPDFNSPEFEGIKNQAGLNRFVLTAKKYPQIRKSPISELAEELAHAAIRLEESLTPQIGGTIKDHPLVEYALAGMDNNLFVSKYQMELPKKEEMQKFIAEQMREWKE